MVQKSVSFEVALKYKLKVPIPDYNNYLEISLEI